MPFLLFGLKPAAQRWRLVLKHNMAAAAVNVRVVIHSVGGGPIPYLGKRRQTERERLTPERGGGIESKGTDGRRRKLRATHTHPLSPRLQKEERVFSSLSLSPGPRA